MKFIDIGITECCVIFLCYEIAHAQNIELLGQTVIDHKMSPLGFIIIYTCCIARLKINIENSVETAHVFHARKGT